ncbi:MAG: hypothetical protein JJU13_15845 [Balneolaceae bacterium]|nr:hypothetical protein [Balneolaceae bacterium]
MPFKKDITEFILSEMDNSDSSGVYVTRILSKGQKQGFHRKEIWTEVVSLFSDKGAQKSWGNWASLSDREEIRLRLKVLNETSTLDESLTDFILFFFRASDPVLYQLSSIVLGREMENNSRLNTYFEQYCKKRNIPADTSVRLNNQRSRRRALLVRASWLINRSNGSDPFPLDIEEVSGLSDSDISITFLSCSLLLEGGQPRCREYAVKLLKHRFSDQKPIRDRNLVRNAGILIVRLKAHGELAGELFHHCFDCALNQYNQADQLATKLQSLFLLDELMETSIHLGLEFTGLDGGQTRQGRFNRFLQSRLSHWARVNQKKYEPQDDTQPAYSISIVDQLYRSNIHEEPEEEYRIFAESVHSFSDASRWRTFTVEERTYRAFYLIDFCIHSEWTEPEELLLLFISNGLFNKLKPIELPESDQLKTALSTIIKRLMELEPSLSRTLFDPQLIHRLADHELLPALIPTGFDPDFLPILADAVEHQVRFLLATDADFKPDHYIYLLTIRRPGASFYRYMLELCSDREYKCTNGELYPLQQVLKYLNRDNTDKTQNPTPFWTALEQLRKKLKLLRDETDPVQLLQGIEGELRGTGAEQLRVGITLHDLLEMVQPSDRAWYRAGLPPFTTQKGNEIVARDQILADALKTKTALLDPKNLNSGFEIGETAQAINKQLDQIRQHILPLLGLAEAGMFGGLLDESTDKVQEWEQVFSQALIIWNERELKGSDDVHNQLVDLLLETDNSSIREKLFFVIRDTLTEEASDKKDSWLHQYELTKWAAGAANKVKADKIISPLWGQALQTFWKQLADEAMDQNAEARVVQLMKAPELASIRKREDARQVLDEIKVWCLNRYDAYHALQCNREMNPSWNPGAGIFKTAREYTSHFARVWLALLIGVIFMFDFGDPWTELAEIGDVGGVIFAFVFGVAGTFLYVWIDLRKRTVYLKNDPFGWISTFGRLFLFLGVTFIYTGLMVCLFWYMFSSTDQVVHGEYAPLHLLSWTGFALFVGVFLGLIGRND